MLILPVPNLTNMNDHLSPINKNQIQKLIREELEPTWFDSKSATPDMCRRKLKFETFLLPKLVSMVATIGQM